MDKIEKIRHYLERVESKELIKTYNNYIGENKDYKIYPINKLEWYVKNESEWYTEDEGSFWLLCSAYEGKFKPDAEYFLFDYYGNIISIYEYNLLEYINCQKIAEFCVNEGCSLDNNFIEEILNS